MNSDPKWYISYSGQCRIYIINSWELLLEGPFMEASAVGGLNYETLNSTP